MNYPDLFNVQFWWIVGLALIVLVPLRHAGARKWALAGINLSIFILMLKARTAAVLALVILAWIVLKLCRRPFGRILLGLGGVATLILFVIHKLPKLGDEAGLGAIDPILTAIGFSYVALRLADAARSVSDGRRPPPDLPSSINYLLPFHMLAAGPIQSYDDFVAQPDVPVPLSATAALRSIERVAGGLFKKYVLAQGLERLFLTGFHASGAYGLWEMQLIYVWLYLDFSAYSDIAVGIGGLMGVATPENFNRPYLARNVIDFWERWHISLSRFIRRNVFIPIQLSLMRLTDGRCAALDRQFRLHGLVPALRTLAQHRLELGGVGVVPGDRAHRLQPLPAHAHETAGPEGCESLSGQPVDSSLRDHPHLRVRRRRGGDRDVPIPGATLVDQLSMMTPDDPPMSRARFLARAALAATQILLAYYLGHSDYFFYQGF